MQVLWLAIATDHFGKWLAIWQICTEVDLGLMADVGTLQRLPKVVGGDNILRELVYTA